LENILLTLDKYFYLEFDKAGELAGVNVDGVSAFSLVNLHIQKISLKIFKTHVSVRNLHEFNSE